MVAGISPCFGNNPAFKIFTVRQDTFTPVDFQSIRYDLAALPAQYDSLYRFSTAYGTMANASLQFSSQQLSNQFVQSDTKRSLYTGFYDAGNTATKPQTNASWNFVNSADWPIFACGISQMDQQNYINCANNY